MSNSSNMKSNKSSLDSSLIKHTTQIFDETSVQNFTSKLLKHRQTSLEKRNSDLSRSDVTEDRKGEEDGS